ncbi:MAG: DUF2207 domain-containing protein [Alphaproteobacteria bacterium]|nr:DUF2207 domain-containing protein [Alphaproteobacteria bacterium]
MRPILSLPVSLVFIALLGGVSLAASHASGQPLHWTQTLSWPLIGFLAAGGYFLWVWQRVRCPPGVIVPSFHPPDAMTPAQIRYIARRGCFDDRTFECAILSLGCKGALHISADMPTRLDPIASSAADLRAEEKALADRIGAQPLELTFANQARLTAARRSVRKALDEFYSTNGRIGQFVITMLESVSRPAVVAKALMPCLFARAYKNQHLENGPLLKPNAGWFFFGFGLTLILIRQTAVAGTNAFAMYFIGATLLVALLFGPTVFCWLYIAASWLDAFASRRTPRFKPRILSAVRSTAAFGALFALPTYFFGFRLLLPFFIRTLQQAPAAELLSLALVLATMALNIVFFYLLRTPTREGRELLDRIEGFRMYLAATEEDRLDVIELPQRTPELFERYYPYAMALDCAGQWSRKFTAVLTAANVAFPHWYNRIVNIRNVVDE